MDSQTRLLFLFVSCFSHTKNRQQRIENDVNARRTLYKFKVLLCITFTIFSTNQSFFEFFLVSMSRVALCLGCSTWPELKPKNFQRTTASFIYFRIGDTDAMDKDSQYKNSK